MKPKNFNNNNKICGVSEEKAEETKLRFASQSTL